MNERLDDGDGIEHTMMKHHASWYVRLRNYTNHLWLFHVYPIHFLFS